MGIRMEYAPIRVILENEILEAQFLPVQGVKLECLKNKKNQLSVCCVGFGKKASAFFAKVCDETGYEFLRAYEYEKETGLLWQAEFHLEKDSQLLMVHTTLINDTTRTMMAKWPVEICKNEKGFFVRSTLEDGKIEKELEPGESYAVTHCYGKIDLDADVLEKEFVDTCIKAAVKFIMPEEKLEEKHKHYQKYSNFPCTKLLYTGSGWGALEQIRRIKENLPLFPRQYLFPAETIGEEQGEELEKML